MLIQKLQPFAIALALGLLIGIERERSHPPGIQAIGLRTFVLFSLLGAIASWVTEPLIAWGITLFVAAIITIGYLRTTHGKDKAGLGITTEVAAVVTFGLGLMCQREPLVALILGVAVVTILFGKQHLHSFSRERLRTEELQATITILILALAVLPFLPNEMIDPWDLFNPQRFGILVLTIAIMQFGAYLIARICGPNRGLLLSGFLMGLISSAIATLNYTNQAKNQQIPPMQAAAAIVYATISMYIKFLIVVQLISPDLLELVIWPVVGSSLLGLALASRLTRHATNERLDTVLPNPLELWSALRLASVLAGMLIAVAVAQRLFGNAATQLVAFLGGLFDIHSVSFAVATLHQKAELNTTMALFSLALTIFASFLSKIVVSLTAFSTNKKFALASTGLLFAMLLSAVLIWGLVLQR